MGTRAFVVLIAAALVVGVSGCSFAEESDVEPTPSGTLIVGSEQSPPPTPDATSTADTSGPPVLDAVPESCEVLLTLERLSDALGDPWYLTGRPFDAADVIPGPSARAAAATSLSSLSCLWSPEAASEGHLIALAYVLEPAVRDDLLASLSEAASYEQLEIHTTPAFRTSEVKGDLRYTTLYAFVDDVWIVIHGPIQPTIVTELTVAAVKSLQASP